MFDAAAYMKARREERRIHLIELAGGCCVRCGCADGLEFDHRDPLDKLFTLSGPDLDRPMDIIMAEFAKCDLLCTDHHVDKSNQNGDYRINRTPAKPFVHGTARTYMEQGCRCDSCKQARSKHRAKQLSYNEVILTQAV